MRPASIVLGVVLVVIGGMASSAAADDRAPVSTTVTSSRGGLARPAAQGAIDGNAGVGRCFRGIISAKVKVTLTVTAAGAVSSVKMGGARKSTRSCLTTALRGLAFPASAKKSTIRVTLDAEMTAMAYAEALTAEDDGSGIDTGMSRSRPGVDLDTQVREATRSGSGSGGGSAGGGSGAGSGSAAPSAPRGRITLAGKQVSGGLAVDKVMNKVLSAYLAGLKRCYKDALATLPALTGSVVLAFEIDRDGRVGTVSATGIDELAPCIRAQMTGWRFLAADAATSVELQLKLIPK